MSFQHDTITPYKNEESKKNQVRDMFNNISGRYDFLNHFLSLGIDKWWRRKALSKLQNYSNKRVLDVATGTADLSILAVKKLNPDSVIGIDIADNMLAIGRNKIDTINLSDKIRLETGDSENLRFDANSFDTAMAAFGVRNFENLEKGIAEMYRVLDKNGVIMILEFSRPRIFPIKQLYNFYFKYILPLIGKIVSKNNEAYNYLYESSSTFPCFEDFTLVLDKIGFKNTRYYPLTFGICTIYLGEKQ